MSHSSSRAPRLLLGTALTGAIFISLISASPTPVQGQVGAAPTATFVTAGSGTPVPTPTPRPSVSLPPTQVQATATVNLTGLGGLSGLNLSQFSELTNLAGEMSRAQTAIAAQAGGLGSPGSAASAGQQFMSQLGAATPTPIPPTAGTQVAGTPQTAIATSQTALATPVLFFSGTPVATLPVGTPPPTPVPVVAQVTAEALPSLPMISIDAPEAGGSLANGRATLVGGWVVDPRIQGAGVVAVDVFVDGAPGTGTFVGAAEQSLMREDVALFFQRPDWERSGFNFEWTPRGLTSGHHTLVVVVQLTAGGSVWAETPFSVR